MPAQSLIQIRVDRPLKDDVSALFSSLGIDMSTAVRMFFQRSRAERGIPFPLTLAVAAPSSTRQVRIGIAKGKWSFPGDWEAQDRELDKAIEEDFYANLA